jgi:hypothetical protein
MNLKYNNRLMSLAVALAVAGCSTTPEQSRPESKPPKADRVQILMYDTTPRPKTTHLDIYGSNLPQRPYKVIALLTCEGAVDQEVVMTTAIYYRARQIGADGVTSAGTITTQKEGTLNVADTVGKQIMMNAMGLGGSGARSVFRAYAIVYTDKGVFEKGNTNSAMTENQTAQPISDDADTKAASDLIGHWESVAFKVKHVDDPAEKIEFDFLPDNQLVSTTITKGKTYTNKGQYTVKGDKLIITSPDTQPESDGYSLIGDHLVITIASVEGQIILQRIQKNTP